MAFIMGTAANDTLAGQNEADIIRGFAGDDELSGEGGDDTLAGDDGSDQLDGGEGNDILFGGAGADNLFGGPGDDVLYIRGNDSTVEGGDGFDRAIVNDAAGVSITLSFGTDYVAGYLGDDVIDGSFRPIPLTLGGGPGNDIVKGGSADDILSGFTGNDKIFGNDGFDQIFGGPGNDRLYGGHGNDNLTLGAGFDVVVVEDCSGTDYVFEFANCADRFDFSCHSSVRAFNDLTITNANGHAFVTFEGGELVVVGGAGLLDPSDFIFA